jgi:hypothetical protein
MSEHPFCPSEFYTVEGSSSKKKTEEELQLKDPEEKVSGVRSEESGKTRFQKLVEENEKYVGKESERT